MEEETTPPEDLLMTIQMTTPPSETIDREGDQEAHQEEKEDCQEEDHQEEDPR
jgi:hypothetical protein